MFGLFKSRKGPTMTCAEAYEKARRGEIHLVDVREPGEWRRMHVAGAIHAPLSTLQRDAGSLPADKPLALICLSGRRSAGAVGICEAAGRSACNVEGGLVAWRSAGLPLEI
ncbi:MAG: rhodanese-like domain-containing protein [Hyphomicrobiaceae bacterium]|nr:rhodanese-like domain-containing protein [Hyphomicrobiaceae bacterium]